MATASDRRAEPPAPGRCGTALHTRLIVGILLTVATVWALWMTGQWWQYRSSQSGQMDGALQYVALNILHALPSGYEATGGDAAYPPPRELETAALQTSKHRLMYQVWLADGRLMMRSPGALEDRPLVDRLQTGAADTRIDGERWRGYALTSADGRVRILVAKPYAEIQAQLRHWVVTSLWTAALIFVCMAAVVWWVVRWSLRPVEQVRHALLARELNDASPLPDQGMPVELRPLLGAFNRCLARLHRSLQGERRFLADAAHELRTPLAALRAQADVARQARSPEELQRALDRLSDGIDRSARLSSQMLDMARLEHGGPAGPAEALDLARLAEVICDDFEPLARRRGQRLERRLAPARLVGHLDEIGILVRNLVDNALRYGHEGGVLRIGCGLEPGPQGAQAVLRVSDDGPGVPAGERQRVLARFYRAAGSRDSGSGIGLSLVQQVVVLHGAELALDDGPGGSGLAVTVRFPAPPAGESVDARPPARPPPAPGWPAASTAR